MDSRTYLLQLTSQVLHLGLGLISFCELAFRCTSMSEIQAAFYFESTYHCPCPCLVFASLSDDLVPDVYSRQTVLCLVQLDAAVIYAIYQVNIFLLYGILLHALDRLLSLLR